MVKAQKMMNRWKFPIIIAISYLLISSCCRDEEECWLVSENTFTLHSLDMRVIGREIYQEMDMTIIQIPSAGVSEYLVLRDNVGKDYRFETHVVDWDKQLDKLQLGKTYKFGIWWWFTNAITGIKIFVGDSLMYLTVTQHEGDYTTFESINETFANTELEGATFEQELFPSCCYPSCCSRKVFEEDGTSSFVTNKPITFKYEKQELKLYQSQEGIISTPKGKFLIHVLYSKEVEPIDYDDGGSGYSFYIRRL